MKVSHLARGFAAALLFATAPASFATQAGTVFGWGDNSSGQSKPFNDPPTGAVKRISARAAGGITLLTNSTVAAFGDNTFNQDNPPGPPTNIIEVAAGTYHYLALKSDGTVIGWGNNGDGQATPPGGLTNVVKIAAGGEHSLALRNDGFVTGWGNNNNGQASPPALHFSAIAAGDKFSVGIETNSHVVAWGDNANGEITTAASITNAIAVAAGDRHGVALLNNSGVVCWGDNSSGQGTVPGGLTNVIGIAAGGDHTLALLGNGAVVGWGHNFFGESTPPSGLSNVIAVAAGEFDSYALKSNGTVVRWGKITTIAKMPPGGIVGAVSVVGGGEHSLALLSNSTVIGWGNNYNGQASGGNGLTNIIAVAAGFEHSLALRSDSTVVGWGNNTQGQTTPSPSLSNVIQIAAGKDFSLALRSNGTVAHWGNSVGLPPGGLTNVTAIAAGEAHGLAVINNGSVVGWGNNTYGQASPPFFSNAVAVAAGQYFSAALLSDGRVFGWGTSSFSLNNPPSGFTSLAIAAGQQHGLALKDDGSIVTWGDNLYQQIPAPSGIPPALAIGAGLQHSLAILHSPPYIVTPPSNITVNAGISATFSVVAGGTTPFTYRWQFNNVDITPPATFTWYTVTNAQFADQGSYRVIIANAAGSITSAPVTLTVLGSPSILVNPASQTVVAASPVTFNVSATGTLPLAYQWRKNGTIIGGANGTNYNIASVSTNDAGNYDVIVTNNAGSATSTLAVLTVIVPPSILTNPANRQVAESNSVSFTVAAKGTSPLFYQWRRNAAPIGGATGSTYAIAVALTNHAGAYDVIVTNVAGSVTSSTASLTVVVRPVITTDPAGQSVAPGNSANFNVAASGTSPLTYQWRHDGSPAGSNATNYAIAVVGFPDAGNYDCVVGNFAGSVTSGVATLTVYGVPTITTQPQNRSVWSTRPVSFSVKALGNPPLNYQWQFNAADIPGETNTSFQIPATVMADGGTYRVIVGDYFGQITSVTATLSVRSQVAWGSRNDFDGDGKSDFALIGPISSAWYRTVSAAGRVRTVLARRHPISSRWFLLESTDGFEMQDLGWTTDLPASGDYDGDGETDVAIYRPSNGMFFMYLSSDGLLHSLAIGVTNGVPVPGDYDNDGATDMAVYDHATGNWTVRQSSDGLQRTLNWGWSGADPVHGDYDGDGATDIAVYDPTGGYWYILQSSNGLIRQQKWGGGANLPAAGDYDGDGKTDLAVYQPSSGNWLILRSSNGTTWQVQWGWSETLAVPGDYDGDTIMDLSVYHPGSGNWYILQSSDGQMLGGGPQSFSATNALPPAN